MSWFATVTHGETILMRSTFASNPDLLTWSRLIDPLFGLHGPCVCVTSCGGPIDLAAPCVKLAFAFLNWQSGLHFTAVIVSLVPKDAISK